MSDVNNVLGMAWRFAEDLGGLYCILWDSFCYVCGRPFLIKPVFSAQS